jgi:DNA-binding XRE family transcriptional regulator
MKQAFVNTIKQERDELNLSQEMLGNKLNLSRQSIHNIENGSDIKLTTAYKFAKFFNKPIPELFTPVGEDVSNNQQYNNNYKQ